MGMIRSLPTADEVREAGIFRLDEVSWDAYVTLRDGEQFAKFLMHYDRGNLEFMAPSPIHEKYKTRLGQMIDSIARVFRIEIVALGQTTYRSEELLRGFEADQCYYLAQAGRILGKDRLDLSTDPPPDLAIEVDITSGSTDKFPLYAALGIPEVWLFDGDAITVNVLRPGEVYEVVDASPALPMVDVAGLTSRVFDGDRVFYVEWIEAFESWLRRADGPDR